MGLSCLDAICWDRDREDGLSLWLSRLLPEGNFIDDGVFRPGVMLADLALGDP